MIFFVSAAFFALGAIISSFIGVLSGRINTGQGFLTGRSQCDACGSSLTPSSLVPIVSYVLSRGRARCCGSLLGIVSPLTELLLGALFTLSYLRLGLTPALPFFLLSLSMLLALVLYDLAHQILPPQLLALFVVSSVVTAFFLTTSPILLRTSLITAFGIAASLALIHFLSGGRAMGFADAPFSFGLAVLTGSTALTGLLFSFWIGAGIGIFLLAQRPSGSRMGVEVPFAPFLAAGFLLAYFTQWNLFALIVALS